MAGATMTLSLSASRQAMRTGIYVSTVKGRCGPCCSTAPTGTTRMAPLASARTFSLRSFSKLFMRPHHLTCRTTILSSPTVAGPVTGGRNGPSAEQRCRESSAATLGLCFGFRLGHKKQDEANDCEHAEGRILAVPQL